MTALERFLRYLQYDTQSEEASRTPSTDRQRLLGAALAQEMQEMGLENAHLAANGAVYGWLIAHMDTAPRVPGGPVRARLVPYHGGDIVLNEARGIVMTPEDFPDLHEQVGRTLVVTDGTTLLGADDKAGIAEVLTALERLLAHPERPHGRVAVCITPDEEVGRGADYVDLSLLGADVGYTVDGGALGSLEYENFHAASAVVTVHGVNIHPGEGKGKLKNACLIAARFIAMVPPGEDPAHTEGYEGFYHLCQMTGDESEAVLHWILRDHDRAAFTRRKETMERIAAFLCEEYGPGSVEVALTDSYSEHEGSHPAPPAAAHLGQGSLSEGGRGAEGNAHPGRDRRRAAEPAWPAVPQPFDGGLPLPRHL